MLDKRKRYANNKKYSFRISIAIGAPEEIATAETSTPAQAGSIRFPSGRQLNRIRARGRGYGRKSSITRPRLCLFEHRN